MTVTWLGFIDPQREIVRTNDFYTEGLRLLTEAREAFPANPILPQYFGDAWTQSRSDGGDGDGGDSGGWEGSWGWVGPQRTAVVGLLSVLRFWCEERQAADGQLGGGWGDDVEVWRNWTPILLGFRDSQIGENTMTHTDPHCHHHRGVLAESGCWVPGQTRDVWRLHGPSD